MPTVISFDRTPTTAEEPLPSLPRVNNNLFVMKHLRSAHMPLGKVTEITTNHLVRIFPKGFFRHVHVGTTLASVVEGRGKSDLATFRKLSPALAVLPTYVPQESLFENNPVYTMLNWQDGMPPPVKDWEKYLSKLFYHETTGKQIFYNITRVKLSFEVAIRLGTELRAWDAITILRRKLRPGYFFNANNQRLPIELPNLLSQAMATEMGIDLTDSVQAQTMLDELNRYSMAKFYIHTDPATGNKGFAYDYIANLLFKVDGDYSYDRGMIGKSQEKTIVSNTISCEFNIPDTFALSTFDPISENFSDNFNIDVSEYQFLNINLTTRPPAHLGNTTLVFQTKFITDSGVNENIDYRDSLPDTFVQFIKAEVAAGRSINMKISVWSSSGPVPLSDYSVNWNTLVLTLTNTLAKQVYQFGVYLDLSEVKKFNQPKIDSDQMIKIKEIP